MVVWPSHVHVLIISLGRVTNSPSPKGGVHFCSGGAHEEERR